MHRLAICLLLLVHQVLSAVLTFDYIPLSNQATCTFYHLSNDYNSFTSPLNKVYNATAVPGSCPGVSGHGLPGPIPSSPNFLRDNGGNFELRREDSFGVDALHLIAGPPYASWPVHVIGRIEVAFAGFAEGERVIKSEVRIIQIEDRANIGRVVLSGYEELIRFTVRVEYKYLLSDIVSPFIPWPARARIDDLEYH